MIPHPGTFHDAEHVIQVTGVQHIPPRLSHRGQNQDIQNIVYRVQPLVKNGFHSRHGQLALGHLETNPSLIGRSSYLPQFPGTIWLV